ACPVAGSACHLCHHCHRQHGAQPEARPVSESYRSRLAGWNGLGRQAIAAAAAAVAWRNVTVLRMWWATFRRASQTASSRRCRPSLARTISSRI
ncbi:unnamed protein product, partial [Phaeothamnion confervicola]